MNFVISFPLNTTENDEHALAKRFYYGYKISNVVTAYAIKQLNLLKRDSAYQAELSEYLKYKKQRDALKSKKSKIPAELKAILNRLGKELSDIRMSYGLSEYQLHAYVVVQQHKYKKYIDSNTAQKIATQVWQSVEKVLYGNGKHLHFHRYSDFLSMENKCNSFGIRYKDGFLVWGDGTKRSQKALKISVQFPRKGRPGTAAKREYEYTRKCLKHKICYCRIKRMPVGQTWHYYLQMVLEGTPPTKQNYLEDSGHIGIDIGTSTIAAVSQDTAILRTLNNGVPDYSKTINRIQRAMDRSRKSTNPGNFNSDGTIKKGIRLRWFMSKNYKRLAATKRSLERKQASALKNHHEALANEIISHGDDIYIETMNFKGLQRRTKETTRRKSGKFNRKGRFGKSLKNCAPAMLINIINRKLNYNGLEVHKVDTKSFKASQYNHATDNFIKKRLSMRHTWVGGNCVQRDLYSAFLLMNSDSSLKHADRDKCNSTFNKFLEIHNALIINMQNDGNNYPSSFGLKYIKIAS